MKLHGFCGPWLLAVKDWATVRWNVFLKTFLKLAGNARQLTGSGATTRIPGAVLSQSSKSLLLCYAIASADRDHVPGWSHENKGFFVGLCLRTTLLERDMMLRPGAEGSVGFKQLAPGCTCKSQNALFWTEEKDDIIALQWVAVHWLL